MGVFCCIYLIQVFISMGRKIKVRLTEQELIDLITKQLSGQDSMDILKDMLSGKSKEISKSDGTSTTTPILSSGDKFTQLNAPL